MRCRGEVTGTSGRTLPQRSVVIPLNTRSLHTARRVQQQLLPSRPVLRQDISCNATAETSTTMPMPAIPLDIPAEKSLLMPLPRFTENAADDFSLENPLARLERMGTGWFGVVLEYEGVLVSSSNDTHVKAWTRIAEEFDYPQPLGHMFRRTIGVKDDAVISRIFNWSKNPTLVNEMVKRKVEIYDELLGGRQPAEMLEVKPFLELMKKSGIPVGLACAIAEDRVKEGLERMKLTPYFDTVVTAEDNGGPEVDFYYSYAASKLERPCARCVVVGESNATIDAAALLGMKCIIVSGNKPVYEFMGADLVVRNLSQLTFSHMKRLFGNEELVASARAEEEQPPVVDIYADDYSSDFGDDFGDDFDDYQDEDDEDLRPKGGLYGSGSRW